MKADIDSLLKQKLMYINMRDQAQQVVENRARPDTIQQNQQPPNNQGGNRPNIFVQNQESQPNQPNQ